MRNEARPTGRAFLLGMHSTVLSFKDRLAYFMFASYHTTVTNDGGW